jgi:hypothetical protein
MNQNAQLRTAHTHAHTNGHTNGKSPRSTGPDITPKLERQWFEFDRSAVLQQIDMMRGTIDRNAGDLGMVAVEGVFEKSLSAELARTSQSLQVLAQELNSLRGQVARASGYPKDGKESNLR